MNHAAPEFVLDSSALLAVLLNEPGCDAVRAVIDRTLIHALNVAEVIGKLVREGVPSADAVASVEELSLAIREDFSLRMAADCGELIGKSRSIGLSLGDCVCLTTAAYADAVAITAERLWKKCEGRVVSGHLIRVELIR